MQPHGEDQDEDDPRHQEHRHAGRDDGQEQARGGRSLDGPASDGGVQRADQHRQGEPCEHGAHAPLDEGDNEGGRRGPHERQQRADAGPGREPAGAPVSEQGRSRQSGQEEDAHGRVEAAQERQGPDEEDAQQRIRGRARAQARVIAQTEDAVEHLSGGHVQAGQCAARERARPQQAPADERGGCDGEEEDSGEGVQQEAAAGAHVDAGERLQLLAGVEGLLRAAGRGRVEVRSRAAAGPPGRGPVRAGLAQLAPGRVELGTCGQQRRC